MSHRFFANTPFSHAITDDMESMMYVVLYCGLRWLPHSVEEGEVETLWMNTFFAAAIIHLRGTVTGGDLKKANRVDREYTNTLGGQFECAAFWKWMTTVMNYNSPLPSSSRYEQLRKMWNGPGPLYKFWDRFLEKNKGTLPERDRVEKKSVLAPSAFSTPHHATTPSSGIRFVQNSEGPLDGTLIYLRIQLLPPDFDIL